MLPKMYNNINLLWKYFKEEQDSECRKKLINYYTPFIKTIVNKIYSTLPNVVELSELESHANLGLIDAMNKYDYRRGIKFETYASIRVSGAIIDGIRKQDWLPRSLRTKGKNEKAGFVNGTLGLNSNYILMSLDDPKFSSSVNNTNLEECLLVNTPDFADKIADRICIKNALKNLNQQERRLIYLYYYRGRTFKEIGKVMFITESRVSQIHKKSLKKLKNIIGSFFNHAN